MPEITFVPRISSWNFLRIGHTYQNTITIALLENKTKQNTKQKQNKTKRTKKLQKHKTTKNKDQVTLTLRVNQFFYEHLIEYLYFAWLV